MFTDIDEVKTAEEPEEGMDSDLKEEIDDIYDRMLSGKSLEELKELRSLCAGEGDPEETDDEDKPKQKVLKRF